MFNFLSFFNVFKVSPILFLFIFFSIFRSKYFLFFDLSKLKLECSEDILSIF